MENKSELIQNLYRGFFLRDPDVAETEKCIRFLNEGGTVSALTAQLLQQLHSRKLSNRGAKIFVAPGHFYSPIVDQSLLPVTWAKESWLTEIPGINLNISGQIKLWSELLPYLKEIPFPEEKQEPWRYYFKNPAYSYGDASILYAILRHFKPKQIVEVGSGFSSACTLDTLDKYLPGRCNIDFVEPYPELLIKLIGGNTSQAYVIHESPVQNVDLKIFQKLRPGDVLFIDSTHVMKTGSDVCHELFQILPRLSPGVIVHFHDIFWPFEYSKKWVIEENRSWNELYGLRAFLMYNDHFEVKFFNDFMVNRFRDKLNGDYPLLFKNTGGSIWLQKTK